jgi:Ni,Fe-hydrogenase III component G
MAENRMAELRIFLEQRKEKVEITQCYMDEIHLSVAKPDIISLAGELYRKLGYILIQMAGNDERALNGCFSLLYTFKDKKKNFLTVIKVLIKEDEAEFPSITPIIPAANWYEREIRDMFGLEPKGHPDKRRLAVHKTWQLSIIHCGEILA